MSTTQQVLLDQTIFEIIYSELFTFKIVVRMLGALWLLFLIILVILIFVNVSDLNIDGFADKVHSDYVTRKTKQWGNIGISLLTSKREGTLGDSADNMLYTVGDKSKNRYPLNTGKVGLFDIAATCEAVKTMDCNAFDDPKFSKSCGICLDIGENSEGSKAMGGLVVLEDDKKSARDGVHSNFIPEYKASVGFCPAGKLVTTKEECLKLQRQLLCNKNSSFDLPGCSQCYTDTTYSIVDEKTSPGVITDSGELSIVGVGMLKIEEQGFSPKTNIRLSAKTPYKYGVRGKETTRVKFTLEPPSNSDPDNPTIPYMAASLSGETGTGTFSSDVRRIVFTDEVTGRKPRSRGMDTVEGTTVTKMAPGFGQTRAIIVVVVPFSFTETTTSESTLCNDGPFVTTQAGAEFLESDPCYKKGSGPGKFSLECLQGAWDTNGCNSSGKGYPKDNASAAKLMTAPNGSFYSLNDLSDYIYNQAIITSTGIDENGVKQEIRDWSKASVFCTGREITSPCDTDARGSGPLAVNCLQHLWDNQGSKNQRDGSTYNYIFGMSIFNMAKMDLRGCSRAGTLSPTDANGNKNQSAIQFWRSKGGVEAVKKLMGDLHAKANGDRLSDDGRSEAFNWCYGTTRFAPRPATVFKIANNRLPPVFNITRNTVLVESLTMTQDYKLQFVIKPKSINKEFTNILLFTKFANGDDWNEFGCRTPAIWFFPNELKLHVRIGGASDYNWGMDVVGCELNKESSFSLECRGSSVRITLDNKVFSATHPDYRYSGNVKVFGSSKQHPAAVADIKDVGLQLFGNSTSTGPWSVTVGNSGSNEKSVPLPPGIPPTARNIKIVSQGHSDNFVCRIDGGNLIVRRVDNYSGWGANYVAEISDGVQPNIENVKTVMLIGKDTWLNFSQIVVLDEKGNNVSRGRPTAGSGKLGPDVGPERAVDGNERPRGHPQEYHSSGDSNRGAYFKVILDNPTKVSSVIIYNREDCCQDRMKKFSVVLINSSADILYQRGGLTEAPVQVIKPALQSNQFAKGASVRDVPMCYSIKYGDLYNAFDNGFAPGTNARDLQWHWDNHGKKEGRKSTC